MFDPNGMRPVIEQEKPAKKERKPRAIVKEVIDWDFAEIEYATGLKSNCEIAKQIGATEGAVRKRAKQYGWVKDLTAKINLKTEHKIRTIEYESHGTSSIKKATEREIIDFVARIQADVLTTERADINRLSALSEKFEHELNDNNDDLEKRSRIMKALTDVREKIINMRRRNYNIKDTSQEQVTSPVEAPVGNFLNAITERLNANRIIS